MKKKPFPYFGNGKGMTKNIPKIREREGNEKIHSHNSGTGIRGFHSWELGKSRSPLAQMLKMKIVSLRNFKMMRRIIGLDGVFPEYVLCLVLNAVGYD